MCKAPAIRNHVLSAAIAAALVTPAVPQVALGQAALEEVIVTAQRREESLQDTPVFVTPLQTEDLTNRNIKNTEDLIGNVAGISGFTNPGARGNTSLMIRGVSAGSASNLSSDPAVGLYFDGVYIGKMLGSSLDVAEIERMEVMRGPQGSLYGRNATAGAVSWITRKPSGEAGLRAIAGYGDENEAYVKLNGDLPAFGEVGEGFGRLALAAGYQMRQRDGLVENVGRGPDFDEIDRYAWRVAANWQPIDSVTADYSYDRSELDEIGAFQQVTGFTVLDAAGTDRLQFLRTRVLGTAQFFATMPGADPRIASRWIPSINQTIAAYQEAVDQGSKRADRGSADTVPTNDTTADGHTLNVDWEAGELGALGEVTFKSITGYRSVETRVTGDLENIDSTMTNGIGAYNDLVHLTLLQIYGGTVAAGFPPVASPVVNNLWNFIDTLGTNHSFQNTRTEYDQFSQELQMIGSTEQLDYLVGALYFSDDGEASRRAYFSAPLAGLQPQSYENSTDSLAFYANGSYRVPALDDRLAVTAGVRYTEEEKGIDYDYGAYQTPFGSVPAQALSRERNFHNLSFDSSVSYRFTDGINGFVRYADAYRSGGFNGEIFNNTFDEETIEQFEVGIKSEWLDQRLRVNASWYTYEGTDLQVSVIRVANNTATSSVVNAGETSRWGTDLEVLAAPIDDLTLGLGWSYISGDFDKFPPTCTGATPPVCLNTNNLAKSPAPDNQVSATMDYTFARTDMGAFGLYLQYNYQDESGTAPITTGLVSANVNVPGSPQVPYEYARQILPSRNLVNARLSWSEIPIGNESLRLTLWGRNLLDEDINVYGINFAALGLYTEQFIEPLTFGIEVAYEF